MYFEIHFDPADVPADKRQAVTDAVGVLLSCVPSYPPSIPLAYPAPRVDAPDQTSVVTSDPADVTCNEATVDDAAAKKAAKAAKAKATREKKKADKVKAEADAAAELTGDTPAEEVSVDEVKAAVVAAIDRLTASGAESPTKPVVEKLEEITGKKKVGEVDASQYQEVIDGLESLGV